jgi:negative regulator of replication initiation
MQIDTNVHRERIDYDYPYGDTLTESEEALYWSATKDAEDAIAQIAKVQEHRKGENGEIRSVLLSDEFQALDDAIQRLDEATTILHLIERAAEWTERREEIRFKTLNELFDEMDDSIEANGGSE